MIVAIDGPAGAGKSSVSRALAKALDFRFLDTGAMYRCVTLACIQQSVSLDDPLATLNLARTCQIELTDTNVWLNGSDVSEAIRRPAIAQAIRPIAAHPDIRAFLVDEQRRICSKGNWVTEGRDQGTVAFPKAECKIFLTASPEERARRRVRQLIQAGVDADYDEILAQQNRRDENDSKRESGPLRVADDAIVVVTDGMSEEEVLEKLIAIVHNCRSGTCTTTSE